MMTQPDEEWEDRGGDDEGAAWWIAVALVCLLIVLGLFLAWLALSEPIEEPFVELNIEPPIKKADRLGPSIEAFVARTIKLEI